MITYFTNRVHRYLEDLWSAMTHAIKPAIMISNIGVLGTWETLAGPHSVDDHERVTTFINRLRAERRQTVLIGACNAGDHVSLVRSLPSILSLLT